MISKELRIGNFVTIDERDSNYTVMWIKPSVVQLMKVGTDYPSCIVEIDRVKGIPITEDILLKLGFTKRNEYAGDLWFSLIGNLELWINASSHKINIDHNEDSITIKHISQLHQLQNLYFALTGEELPTDKILNTD